MIQVGESLPAGGRLGLTGKMKKAKNVRSAGRFRHPDREVRISIISKETMGGGLGGRMPVLGRHEFTRHQEPGKGPLLHPRASARRLRRAVKCA